MHPNFAAWALRQGPHRITVTVERADGVKGVLICQIGPGMVKAQQEGLGVETWRGKLYLDELGHQASKMAREAAAHLTLRRDDGGDMTQQEAIKLYGDTVREESDKHGPMMAAED